MLETELKFFADNLETLLQNHVGKFALVKGAKLIGVYDTDEAAFDAGVAQLGNSPMLIKRIERDERVDRASALLCGWSHA